MAVMAVTCLNACGKNQKGSKTDTVSVQVEESEAFENTDEETNQKSDSQLSEVENKKKEVKLKVQPDLEAEADENTDNLIVSDKDGNSAKVQVGVAEGDTIIPDAPDESSDIEIQNKPNSTETSKENAAPSQSQTTDNDNSGSGSNTTYEEYEAMSGTEQTMFYYSFADADEFLDWYNKAKAEYEAEQEKIYVGMDGVVNAGENN